MAHQSPNAIGFCVDGSYIDFVPAAIESIVRHWQHRSPLPRFDILVDTLPSKHISELLNSIVPGGYATHVIDATVFSDLKEVTHISRGMYYRLLLAEICRSRRILYLDCDVLVRRDISQLFELDLGGNIIGAVVNPFYNTQVIGLDPQQLYFNSGVLLIDRDAWNQANVSQRTLDFLRGNNEFLVMPDQDALNFVLNGQWRELDPAFNCQISMFLRHGDLEAELADRWRLDFLDDPAIVHFSSSHKQWHPTTRLRYAAEYKRLSTHVMRARKGALRDAATSIWRKFKFARNPYFS